MAAGVAGAEEAGVARTAVEGTPQKDVKAPGKGFRFKPLIPEGSVIKQLKLLLRQKESTSAEPALQRKVDPCPKEVKKTAARDARTVPPDSSGEHRQTTEEDS